MSRNTWSSDERALHDKIKALISEEFGDLTRPQAEAVFAHLLDEIAVSGAEADGDTAKTVQTDSSSGWTGRMTSDVVNPLAPASSPKAESSRPRPSVLIRADDAAKVEGVLHQVMEVGALLVQLSPAPPLNDMVQLSLEFPSAHLTVEVEGRVVNNSERGTAIEVSSLDREDLVALQAIRKDAEQERMNTEGTSRSPGMERRSGEGRRFTGVGGAPGVNDSIMEPGAVPSAVQESDDPRRSFAPLRSRRGQGRRMVHTTTRRRVDLPDPDMNLAQSPTRVKKDPGKSTREFYGPPPSWKSPVGDADRIEELAGDRVVDILLQLSENGFSGVLIHEVDGQEREELLFDGGYVVERATQPRVTEEELGPMLLAADRITRRQLAMAAAHADEFELTVSRSLMELDILNPDEIRHAIAGRLTFVLREFCQHQSGTIRIYEARALSAGFLPQPPLRVHVAVERVVFDRLYRRLSQMSGEARDRRMAEALDTYPEVVEFEQDRLERAVTREPQRRLLDRIINGRRRLREVMTESALSSAETFAVVFSLHRMGLVRFDRSLHDTVVRERLRENVTVKYLSVHKASYFEVLNVHWSSYSKVIKEAYENLVEQFDPAQVPDEMEDEVRQRVSEINERVEAAYAALAKRKTRHAYRTRIMPEYKLEHAIPLFLKQCELAERRQHWSDARDSIMRVLEIDPDHRAAGRKLARLEQIISGQVSPDPEQTNQ